jgi:hypothetical protein
MALDTKTAVLIIHGVGPHGAFEVTDSFVHGFLDVYKEQYPNAKLAHKVKQRGEWFEKDGQPLGNPEPWVESYVRLTIPGQAGCIDFYEYFWDIYMVHKTSLGEAVQLLIKASKSANDFYKEYEQKHPGLLQKATDLGGYGIKTKLGTGRVEFRKGGYLQVLHASNPVFNFFFVGLIRALPYLPWAISIIDWWSKTQMPIVSQLFRATAGFLDKASQNFAGDLVRYLDLDPRSERFDTRQKIQNGALEAIYGLIKDSKSNDQYKNYIVAGHSLGSVISYDALNMVISETNAGRIKESEAEKITGLVTFGSPLDKIALFFREHINKGKDVQRQVLANLHGFRSISFADDSPAISVEPALKFRLEKTHWMNFYHHNDLVSGKLDLYDLKDDDNIRITDDTIPISAAHGCYWGAYQSNGKGTNQMYEKIIEEFFK